MAIDPHQLDTWKRLVERHQAAEYDSPLDEMMVLDEFAEAVVELADELQRVRRDHAAALVAARAEAERARAVLRELEYSRPARGRAGVAAECPVCGGAPARGHEPGCRLAAALR